MKSHDRRCGPVRETGESWVRVMAEVAADGLWDEDGSPLDADEVPIDDALRSRLKAWSERYADWVFSDGYETGFAEFDLEAFSVEGLAIARAIKAALPGWTVIYLDLAALRKSHGSEADVPRETFEYLV